MEKVYYYQTDLCRIGIAENDGKITNLFFADQCNYFPAPIQETPLLKEANRQLQEYFARARKVFDLPLNPQGTDFQLQVWQALCDIPYGETRSYQDIAIAIGNKKACRAVGQANNHNPIAIIIPCHRVIGANGALVGFAGRLDLKVKLLKLENPQINLHKKDIAFTNFSL